MADDSSKRLMELQMEDLQETYGVEKQEKEDRSGRPEDLEIATLYADAWDYEVELELFETELQLIKEHATEEIVKVMKEHFENDERGYDQELRTVVESSLQDEAKLSVIWDTPFSELTEKLNTTFSDYTGDFEKEIKEILIQRWEMYIEVKKEHIKEETDYIKTLGLKPHYAKKIYKRYHGIN